ncbi:NAD(P)-dependent oxidoreductase [Arthrobacter tecti]
MRILVTGHLGMVGQAVTSCLLGASHEVVGYDVADGQDVLDADLLVSTVRDCEAVVHLAALDEPQEGDSPFAELLAGSTAEDSTILQTNVGGTYNVIRASERAGIQRIVFMSSVDVFGCFMGQGEPAYLPIDELHPLAPKGAYAWSKVAGEELCRTFTATTGTPSVCLRAPGVFATAMYEFIKTARRNNPGIEWDPYWEYGAFVDVRDLAAAVLAALVVPLAGHHRLLVNAKDISSATDKSLVLADRLLPGTPIRNRHSYEESPFKALIDASKASELLGWRPIHNWECVRNQEGSV